MSQSEWTPKVGDRVRVWGYCSDGEYHDGTSATVGYYTYPSGVVTLYGGPFCEVHPRQLTPDRRVAERRVGGVRPALKPGDQCTVTLRGRIGGDGEVRAAAEGAWVVASEAIFAPTVTAHHIERTDT